MFSEPHHVVLRRSTGDKKVGCVELKASGFACWALHQKQTLVFGVKRACTSENLDLHFWMSGKKLFLKQNSRSLCLWTGTWRVTRSPNVISFLQNKKLKASSSNIIVFVITDSVLRRNQHWLSGPDVQRGVWHGVSKPVGAFGEMLAFFHCLL